MAKRRGSRFDAVIGEIVRLYREGATTVEIGNRFGTSAVHIRWSLRRAGIDLRTRSEAATLAWSEENHVKRRATVNAGPYAHLKPRGPLRQLELALTSPEEPLYHCPECDRSVPASGWRHHNDPRYRDRRVKCRCKACWSTYYQRPEIKERRRQVRVNNAAETAAVARLTMEILRDEVIDAYGGQCVCCGAIEKEFLAIDHALGAGNRHRAHLRTQGIGGGLSFYKWLLNSGLPSEFRVLCHNCNHSRSCYGYCPHEAPRPFVPEWEHLPIPERHAARARANRRQLRAQVIAGYGGRCNCCPESQIEFMAIDHVGGDGAEHRRQLQAEGIDTRRFFKDLIARGFPERFQLLCHNCNTARGFYGRCPHSYQSILKRS